MFDKYLLTPQDRKILILSRRLGARQVNRFIIHPPTKITGTQSPRLSR